MRKTTTIALFQGTVKTLLFTLIFSVSFIFHTIAQEFAITLGPSHSATEIKEDNLQKLRVQYIYEGIGTFGVSAKGMSFNEIFIPNTYWIGELGMPKLPASKDLIEIPFGAEVKVRVNSYDVTEYTLSDFGIEHPIMPVQRSVRKDQNVDEIPFDFRTDIYSKDAFVKHELASVEVIGVLRGIRIGRLTVAPVSYNPVKGVIRVYNNIDVELSFSDVDVALNEYIKASTQSHYFDIVRSAILNNPLHGYPAHPDLTKYPVKYLIVSHRMFENQLTPFIEWKTKKGYEVVLAFTDVIGATFTQIQQWVHTQYNAATPTDPAPSFLLLVGDVQQVPSLLGTSSGKMTDLYYASVDGDFFPEMYYGRFSAQNINQLIPQIEKTLFYETYAFTDPSYLNKVTLIAGADAFWNPNVGQPTIHYGTNNYFNTTNGFTDIHVYLTSPYTGCYGPSRIAVGFINYTAHCNQTSWGDPLLTQTMVNNFTNAGLYPLAIGNCCLAADFGFNECIGETWQRAANKGSVAYIGSSPNSYWFEDFYWAVGAFPIVGNNNGYVPTYAETTWGVYDAPFVSNYVTTGAFNFVGNLAVTEVDIQGYASHSSPLYYWQAYNVLGDPSLVPFFTTGSVNTVSHLPILPIGLNTYEVSASPGSYVAISKSGVLHGAALVGSTGTVTVNIDPVLTAGMVDIVVTKPQFIPYMVQVPAAALQGPFVFLDSFTINDSTGNNNGLADYGETISLNVTLKNVGSDPSGIVTATVTGTDQFITLTGPASAPFGPIPAGASVTVNNAYTFQVAQFVPNQHKANFILNMTEGTNTWSSNLNITLQAPVLNIPASFIINDAQSGNNNGILDPGETALVTVNVKNTGNSNVANGILNITSPDPLLIINNPTVTIGNIAAGTTAEVSFSVTADASSPSGYPVNVELAATAGPNGEYSANQTIIVVIGLIPTYNIGNTTVTTCIGLFYDSGGPGNNYANNEDFTMTFFPHTPGSMIRANFLSFNTESVHDKLFVYNGPNANSPQFPGSPFTGTANPGMFTAQNASGALTFRFTSDGSVVRPGWEAEIFCYTFTSPPLCATNPTPANGASNVALNSQLSWTATDATHFDLYFGTSMNPPYLATLSTNSFSTTLVPNSTYFWRVVPKNSAGAAQGCEVWSFTTGDPVYPMVTGLFTVSNGMFYDSGGPNANYSNNEDHTITFMPVISGYQMEFTFLSFNTESGYDKLFVYNGPTENSPQFAGSPFQGTILPGTLTSTHPTGAITFRFSSDGSANRAGWAASFKAAGPLATFPISSPIAVCVGNSAQLYARAVGGTGNYTYNWSPATGLNNTTVSNPIANPPATTSYTVVVNDGIDNATGNYTLNIHENPVIDLGPDTLLCQNQSIVLDATIPYGVNYLWSPGGETTPTITVDFADFGLGSHTISVAAHNLYGCSAESSILITFDPCLFVEKRIADLNIVVYPNPVRNLLNVSLSGESSHLELTLLNYQGQMVFRHRLGVINGRVNKVIDASVYPKGVYYLRINTENNVMIRKIVIQ